MDNNLHETAKALVSNFKGILAADESLPTIQKRFDAISLENTEGNRRAYRELLFTTPEIEKYISGVIMFDETIKQETSDERKLAKVLEEKGIIPGIKVDKGKIDFPGFPGESLTQGLDDLGKRLEEYKTLGAKFTKWRAVITIGEGIPTGTCIEANIHLLTMFAAISQQAGLVPIVEPEVLMDGAHDLAKCEDITRAVLSMLYLTLQDYKIDLAGTLLKPNMVVSGKDCQIQASPEEIAQSTISVLKRCVPSQVPGIVFLSGGQTPEQASLNLDAINKIKGDSPWELSFSFGRALQDPVLKTWVRKTENIKASQDIFLKRAKLNWLSRQGKYSKEEENS